jgi:hypothetical protein
LDTSHAGTVMTERRPGFAQGQVRTIASIHDAHFDEAEPDRHDGEQKNPGPKRARSASTAFAGMDSSKKVRRELTLAPR